MFCFLLGFYFLYVLLINIKLSIISSIVEINNIKKEMKFKNKINYHWDNWPVLWDLLTVDNFCQKFLLLLSCNVCVTNSELFLFDQSFYLLPWSFSLNFIFNTSQLFIFIFYYLLNYLCFNSIRDFEIVKRLMMYLLRFIVD